MLKLVSSLIIVILLTSCGSSDWFDDDKNKKRAVGKRISISSHGRLLTPSKLSDNIKVKIPTGETNEVWPSSNIHTMNFIENFALKSELKESKAISIKYLTKKEHGPVTPVIVRDHIFLVNDGTIYAYDINTGKELWNYRNGSEKDKGFAGGGITYLDGIIYATAGYKEVLAIEAISGKLKWKYELPNISKTSPAVFGEKVFVLTSDNTIYAINKNNGSLDWKHDGASEEIGIVGAASPKALGNIVIVPYSSDQLLILDSKSGAELLDFSFSKNDNFSQNFVFNDINITPLIKNRNAYVINNDGVLVSINLDSGTIDWKQDVKGTKDVWIAGDYIYTLNNLNEVLAIHVNTGELRWSSKIELKKKEFTYGPVVAGGKLLITTSNGKFIQLSLQNGKILSEHEVAKNLVFSPIVVNKKLYLIEKSGKLHIWQ
jgi:outer membrane protein assembly factor BamB